MLGELDSAELASTRQLASRFRLVHWRADGGQRRSVGRGCGCSTSTEQDKGQGNQGHCGRKGNNVACLPGVRRPQGSILLRGHCSRSEPPLLSAFTTLGSLLEMRKPKQLFRDPPWAQILKIRLAFSEVRRAISPSSSSRASATALPTNGTIEGSLGCPR